MGIRPSRIAGARTKELSLDFLLQGCEHLLIVDKVSLLLNSPVQRVKGENAEFNGERLVGTALNKELHKLGDAFGQNGNFLQANELHHGR